MSHVYLGKTYYVSTNYINYNETTIYDERARKHYPDLHYIIIYNGFSRNVISEMFMGCKRNLLRVNHNLQNHLSEAHYFPVYKKICYFRYFSCTYDCKYHKLFIISTIMNFLLQIFLSKNTTLLKNLFTIIYMPKKINQITIFYTFY